MAKTAIPDAPRKDTFMVDPERIVIITDPTHPRYDARAELDPEEKMIRNIMHNGVIQPVVVRVQGAVIEVIAGRQRVKAARIANQRLVAEGKEPIRVPCFTRKGTDKDLFGVTISENEQRRDDSPFAKADKAQKMLNLGADENEVSIAFGVTMATVRNWLSLLDLAQPVREAVELGIITSTAAMQLADLSAEDQIARLEAMRVGGGKLTVERMKRAVKTGSTSEVQRMKTRKEIKIAFSSIEKLNGSYVNGYRDAMAWVMGQPGATPPESLGIGGDA